MGKNSVDERQEQIKLLATKLLGRKVKVIGEQVCCELMNGVEEDGDICIGWKSFDPFINPRDCEMLKVKLCDMGYHLRVMRFNKEAVCDIFRTNKGTEVVGRTTDTEYEAVCLAALQLPECGGEKQ